MFFELAAYHLPGSFTRSPEKTDKGLNLVVSQMRHGLFIGYTAEGRGFPIHTERLSIVTT